MSVKTDRLTGLGIRDSFLPRVQALLDDLDGATRGLNYLLYDVDDKSDRAEEDRLAALLYAASELEAVCAKLGNMR